MRLITFLISLFMAFNLSAAKKKTFVYCSEASPKIFNPQLGTDGATFNASSRTIYNRLVEFKQGSTKVSPGLATKWTVSKDGKEFTFDLRKGVQFHTTENYTPKRTFNADDVLFSFNRMMDKSHPYHLVNGGTYEYFRSMDMGKVISKVEKLDEYKIKFILTRPEAPFLANLAMDFASILSAEYGDHLAAKKQKEKIDMLPVGTGPFVFKKYVKDTLIRYTAHVGYYEGKAKIDNLIFSITTDKSVRTQKLKAGECHFVNEPSVTDIASIRANKKLKVISQPGLNVGYLAMNTEKKPFDNVLVRQAINHALNREAYMKAIYLGNATVAKNPIPPTMWSYQKATKGYDFDPEKAKKLLKKAGLENGFETTIWTLPVSRPYNPSGKKMGEMMQADLAKVGIKVKLVTFKWTEYLKKASAGEHDMLQLGWTGDNGDPDNFLNTLLGCAAVKAGSNYARWCNKKYQFHVERAKVSTDIGFRSKHYKEAQAIFKQQVPWVTIAHSKVFKAMAKGVTGYTQSPFGSDIFYGVDIQ